MVDEMQKQCEETSCFDDSADPDGRKHVDFLHRGAVVALVIAGRRPSLEEVGALAHHIGQASVLRSKSLAIGSVTRELLH